MEYSSTQKASPLRELTCHTGSHSITCRPAEVTFPPSLIRDCTLRSGRLRDRDDSVRPAAAAGRTRSDAAARRRRSALLSRTRLQPPRRRRGNTNSPIPLTRGPIYKTSYDYLTIILKVKFSHTRYRALGPELIPVYRQSARR